MTENTNCAQLPLCVGHTWCDATMRNPAVFVSQVISHCSCNEVTR